MSPEGRYTGDELVMSEKSNEESDSLRSTPIERERCASADSDALMDIKVKKPDFALKLESTRSMQVTKKLIDSNNSSKYEVADLTPAENR